MNSFVKDITDLISIDRKNQLRKERGFASVMYVQSSCEAPSDRDTYVAELMRHIDIDSYGQCIHNKDLPPHIAEPVDGMFHDDFLTLVGENLNHFGAAMPPCNT